MRLPETGLALGDRVAGILRVRLGDPSAADALSLLDVEGEELPLSFLLGSVTLGSSSVGIEGGVSNLIRTDESARTLVLYRNGLEVQRVPLALRAGEVNELQL